jgi:hypothetical protein
MVIKLYLQTSVEKECKDHPDITQLLARAQKATGAIQKDSDQNL